MRWLTGKWFFVVLCAGSPVCVADDWFFEDVRAPVVSHKPILRQTLDELDEDEAGSQDSQVASSDLGMAVGRLSKSVLRFSGHQERDCDCLRCAIKNHKVSGFIDFNYYVLDDDYNNLTMNILANLPLDFQYFQLTNYVSPVGQAASRQDWNNFYGEFNLRRPIAKDNPWLKHLDWAYQYADGGTASSRHRFGTRWRFQDMPGPIGKFVKDVLKLRYSIGFHFLESGGRGWQMEHVYHRKFCDGRIYVSGFCDHNISNDSDNSNWVTEHQVGFKISELFPLYAIAEWRYNSFPAKQYRSSLGVGLEYVVRFQ